MHIPCLIVNFPCLHIYLESSQTEAEPPSLEAGPRERRAQGEQLLVWGPWHTDITLRSQQKLFKCEE